MNNSLFSVTANEDCIKIIQNGELLALIYKEHPIWKDLSSNKIQDVASLISNYLEDKIIVLTDDEYDSMRNERYHDGYNNGYDYGCYVSTM